jgi:hypothetical protein
VEPFIWSSGLRGFKVRIKVNKAKMPNDGWNMIIIEPELRQKEKRSVKIKVTRFTG